MSCHVRVCTAYHFHIAMIKVMSKTYTEHSGVLTFVGTYLQVESTSIFVGTCGGTVRQFCWPKLGIHCVFYAIKVDRTAHDTYTCIIIIIIIIMI